MRKGCLHVALLKNFYTTQVVRWRQKPHLPRDDKAVTGKGSLILYLFTCSPLHRSVTLALCLSTLECLKLSRPLLQLLAPAEAKLRALGMRLELLDPPDSSLPGSLVPDLLAPCASLTDVEVPKAAWD